MQLPQEKRRLCYPFLLPSQLLCNSWVIRSYIRLCFQAIFKLASPTSQSGLYIIYFAIGYRLEWEGGTLSAWYWSWASRTYSWVQEERAQMTGLLSHSLVVRALIWDDRSIGLETQTISSKGIKYLLNQECLSCWDIGDSVWGHLGMKALSRAGMGKQNLSLNLVKIQTETKVQG